MTEQKFSHAGITVTPKGAKVRFTNNMATRVKRLVNGASDFIALPSPMTKLEAANYLLTLPKISADADNTQAVQKVVSRFTTTAKAEGSKAQGEKAPKAEKPKSEKPKAADKAPKGRGAVRVANVSKDVEAKVEAAVATDATE